ncbi:tRNA (5-methylaminomethyl-2-thiouridine)(34)-methyltransferase MnmD [uncultured Dokdonia sp.]|uniref:tRNA (5-methylaminomethyl-2-thiouridine)(34)-methyltransferase MnmD n=1 Tax=uncultured Dokdonia sp. TaxID=575653 RepID=UPI00261DDEC6|nr:tRNA (5-methylaminomethyl-2-thiouridine)(34)-methyltransferase MnmD [uncultured Dokdonia sp.]
MKREIIITGDGSKTIHIPEWDEQYHSKHGAIQEANHVFLKMGLAHYRSKSSYQKETPIAILEMGFGTGLNVLLTFFEAQKTQTSIQYTGIEAYPISSEEIKAMDYVSLIKEKDAQGVYNSLHKTPWESQEEISPLFQLTKRQQRFEDIIDQNAFDLVYFDAFGARVQPELWGEMIFKKMYTALRENGVLVTYAAKGSVRRALQAVGFEVERLPGPPGKREMLRATKI